MTYAFGGRAFGIRGLVLSGSALTFCVFGCTAGELSGIHSSGASNDAGMAGNTAAPDATTGAPTLVLEAFGGGPGEVGAVVPLDEPGVGIESTCTAPANAGACQLASCQLGGIGTPGRGYGNFGPISVSVGTVTVPLTYNGSGYGTVYFPSSITLGAGGTMTFQGEGAAGVPPFDVSATIPGVAIITAPTLATDGGDTIIDTSRDLPVTWTPISAGQVHFRLTGGIYTPNSVSVSIACTFDGASGSGVVPQALLASMKTMPGASPTSATVRSELDATTVVDGLTIVTQSTQNTVAANANFNVALQ